MRDFYTQHRVTITVVVGIPLLLGFLFVHLLAIFTQGLVGETLVVMVRNSIVISVVLSPLIALPVIYLRKALPTPRRDVVVVSLGVTLLAVLIVRLFNVDFGGGRAGFLAVGPVLITTLFIAVLPAVGAIDLVRFRSPRILALAAALFVSLSVTLPAFGFEVSQGCLDEYRDSVLAEIEANGSDDYRLSPNSQSGRCGPIAWTSTFYDEGSKTMELRSAGGILGQEGMVWGDDIQTCQDTDIYLCRDLRDLGGGWHMYSKVATAN